MTSLKAEFDFTTSDLVEVAAREASRSASVRTQQRMMNTAGVAIWGVIIYAITEATPWNVRDRIIFSAAICAMAFLFMLIPRTSPLTKRLLKYYRQKLGGDGPFRCEVELGPEGLITRQFGSETKREWSNVKSVTDSNGGVEFTYAPVGTLLVRDRAFATPDARLQFLEAAKAYVEGQHPARM